MTSLKPLKQRKQDKVLALMGCMVGAKTDELEKRFPYVDVFMQPQQYQPLIDILGERMDVDTEGCIGPLVGAPGCGDIHPDNSWLRQVLHILHHPVQAGQGSQPLGSGDCARGGDAGEARRERGYAAWAEC